jgi:hypothetical protein
VQSMMENLSAEEVLSRYAGGERNFSWKDLSGLDLRDADLRDTNLFGSNLSNTNLTDANLEGANLEGANLGQANLRGALLRNAHLRRVFLAGADLTGADVTGAEMMEAQIPPPPPSALPVVAPPPTGTTYHGTYKHYLISEVERCYDPILAQADEIGNGNGKGGRKPKLSPHHCRFNGMTCDGSKPSLPDSLIPLVYLTVREWSGMRKDRP